jgi:hypothetical protein
MSSLSPEFTTEKLNESNNKAKYSMFYVLIYSLKRNMHFLKKNSAIHKSYKTETSTSMILKDCKEKR